MASTTGGAASATGPNAETIEAWDGPLYERFERFRPIVTSGLGAHGEAALALFPPAAGQRVLDVVAKGLAALRRFVQHRIAIR